MSSVECQSFPSASICPIRVHYSDVPGAFTRFDFAAGGADCHLVQIQPTQDGRRMEVHFTSCQDMMVDLGRALELCDIEAENDLLSPFVAEYRRAGLCVGFVRGFLNEKLLRTRLWRTGRPLEFVSRKSLFETEESALA